MTDRPALRLDRLALRGYRNLADVDLEPGPRFNVLSGDNGQGKSNLLEAIDYLGSLSSFRLAKKDDLIAHGAERALLAGRFATEPAPITAKVRLERRAARKLALDDKRPRSTAAWVASLQMVLFHPGDLALAAGAPEKRRAFLDRVLEQMDPTYAKTLASYGKALRSRNRLLKREEADRRSIVAYDELLASAGALTVHIGLYLYGSVLLPGVDLTFANPGVTGTLGGIAGIAPVLVVGWWLNRKTV